MTPYFDDGAGRVIYHGDCLEIMPLIEADVMVTDPPYGMAFRSSMRGKFGASQIAGDESPAARDEALSIWGDRPALVFGRWSVARPAGTKMVLTWEKGEHSGMGDLRIPWKPNTEEVYVLGPSDGFCGKRTGSVLRHLAVCGAVGTATVKKRRHPTEKPLGLLIELIRKTSEGTVLDPFMGSGTTLEAARDLGRRAIGIEIEERYCEAAARRLSQRELFA